MGQGEAHRVKNNDTPGKYLSQGIIYIKYYYMKY